MKGGRGQREGPPVSRNFPIPHSVSIDAPFFKIRKTKVPTPDFSAPGDLVFSSSSPSETY